MTEPWILCYLKAERKNLDRALISAMRPPTYLWHFSISTRLLGAWGCYGGQEDTSCQPVNTKVNISLQVMLWKKIGPM